MYFYIFALPMYIESLSAFFYMTLIISFGTVSTLLIDDFRIMSINDLRKMYLFFLSRAVLCLKCFVVIFGILGK